MAEGCRAAAEIVRGLALNTNSLPKLTGQKKFELFIYSEYLSVSTF